HAQRVIDGKTSGAKLIVFDTRLSNTATHADHFIAPYPGSEAAILLSIANYLIQNNLYDREFVQRWWNWQEFLEQRSEAGVQSSESQSGEMFIEREPTSAIRSRQNARHLVESEKDQNENSGSINMSRLRREEDDASFQKSDQTQDFQTFEGILKELYASYTFDFAAKESGVEAKTIEEIAKLVATAGTRLSSHNWRSV